MTSAFWVATASYFLGQAKFFPEPARKIGLLAVPALLVAGLGVYWLVRTLRGRRVAVARHGAGEVGQDAAAARNVT
jgi:ABC-type nickel/cobalt efflux system permease component RcnA